MSCEIHTFFYTGRVQIKLADSQLKCKEQAVPMAVIGVCLWSHRYMCYCGKLQDPPADPWLAPHSCGSVCQRELKPTCGHTCLLLCHPGMHAHTYTNNGEGLSSDNQQQRVHSRSLPSVSKDGLSLLLVWQG